MTPETNVAYDLSIYELDEERHIARKEKKESKIINAKTKFSLGRRIIDILSVALVIGLVVSIVYTNAKATAITKEIATVEAEIVELKSERDYLNFTLESRMTLDEIETYATGTLGMIKMDSSQQKYVELEDSNVIVVYESPVKAKFTEIIQPLVTFLVP